MALNRGQLANIDRRLLAELDRGEDWQLVRVPASAAVWSTWRRFCDVVGISMGRAIGALVHRELAAVVDEELEEASVVFTERERMLDVREAELDEREREIEWRENMYGRPRQPSPAELEAMADEIEPADPIITVSELDPEPDRVQGSERVKGRDLNKKCWCGSGLKVKKCCGARGKR